MIRRRPKVMVNAFRRLFGGRPADAPADDASTATPVALARLPGPPGLPLTWEPARRPAKGWELREDATIYATLRTKGTSGFAGRTASTDWTLTGRWASDELRVQRATDAQPPVRFRRQFLARDRVERAAGETLRWSAGVFGTPWRLETEDGRVLIEIRSEGAFRARHVVSLHEAARALPDLEPLILLTLALPVLAGRQSHAH